MTRHIEQKHIPYFVKCGVPHSVLLSPMPDSIEKMMSTIEVPKKGSEESIFYDKKKQLSFFYGMEKAILRDDLRSGGRLIVISSREIDHMPNQLALKLAAFTVENAKTFHWHTVYGGFKDDLRDDEATQIRIKGISLLVISNLADNSTNAKVEKARDLLVRYSRINRVLVTTGKNPMEYAKDILRMRADAFISF